MTKAVFLEKTSCGWFFFAGMAQKRHSKTCMAAVTAVLNSGFSMFCQPLRGIIADSV